jgi:hypothetical protein
MVFVTHLTLYLREKNPFTHRIWGFVDPVLAQNRTSIIHHYTIEQN